MKIDISIGIIEVFYLFATVKCIHTHTHKHTHTHFAKIVLNLVLTYSQSIWIIKKK